MKMNEVNRIRLIENALELKKFAEENPEEWKEMAKEIEKKQGKNK